jgi:hypothetical protein
MATGEVHHRAMNLWYKLTYADVCGVYADVCRRMRTSSVGEVHHRAMNLSDRMQRERNLLALLVQECKY